MYLEGNGRQDSRQVQSQVFLWPHHILRSHNHMCEWIIVNTPLSVCGLKPYSLSTIIIFSMPWSWPWCLGPCWSSSVCFSFWKEFLYFVKMWWYWKYVTAMNWFQYWPLLESAHIELRDKMLYPKSKWKKMWISIRIWSFVSLLGGETGIVMQIRICPTSPPGTEFKPINSKYIYKVDSFPLQSGWFQIKLWSSGTTWCTIVCDFLEMFENI